jgi:hypothetical protein
MMYYWVLLAVAFFVLWIFIGGKKYEFVGLKPLFTKQPLPKDPFSMNPLLIKHLNGDFSDVYEQQAIETQPNNVCPSQPQIDNVRTNHLEDVSVFEESSYAAFVENNDPNNIYPHIEQRRIHPVKDKKRISELLYMTMPSSIKSKYKVQNVCCEVLTEIYKKPFASAKPSWLKNPETGSLLEIDCYNDELKLGVEYNGIQHYNYPNSFHKTYEEFIKQVRRDQFKHKKCDENNVYLITVPYNVPVEKIKEYILHYLPENVSRRSEPNLPAITYQEYFA